MGVKAAVACIRQPYHFHVPTVLKYGIPNLLEPSGSVQACNAIALPSPYVVYSTLLPIWRAATDHHSEVQGLVKNAFMLFQLLSPKLFFNFCLH